MAQLEFSSDDSLVPLFVENANRVSGSIVSFEDGPTELRALESDGVDGREWATVGKRSEPLLYTAYVPFSGTSQNVERQLYEAQGPVGTLRLTEADGLVTLSDVVLVRVRVLRITGKLLGFGSGSGVNRTLVISLEFDI